MSQNSILHVENGQKSSVLLNLDNETYQAWRDHKLANCPAMRNESIVTLADMANLQSHEIRQIIDFCGKTNMAIYQSQSAVLPADLEKFGRKLGLKTTENHRSAGEGGVVSIEQTARDTRGGYIPYTDKPLSWHTDGYYNAPKDRIRAMVLHCVHDASEGGVNELLDPDIVYIRLRDENPQFITALSHRQAMTIPENIDPRSAYRPDSVGPVFETDDKTGKLHMRYSARTRNIIWRDDPVTDQARAYLTEILQSDPLIIRHKLQPGQGVISNNVLHNRTGFSDTSDEGATRLLYRLRYKERVAPPNMNQSRNKKG